MDVKSFQEKVLAWYASNKRDLPWRMTTDPYKILVSEVMLQQTQVDRVLGYYAQWLEKYPNVVALSRADTHELLSLWSGLGYNNRALRLRACAQKIVSDYDGMFPDEEEELLKLPGIGPYTARAVLAFAFNYEVPVIDTNIRRVLIHELDLDEGISVKELEKIAYSCVPVGRSCEWHNALMDYGALVKTARSTGIRPTSRQSKFEGSDRQVRGKILRLLLKEKKVSVERIRKEMDRENIDEILEKMIKDGIIEKKGRDITLT